MKLEYTGQEKIPVAPDKVWAFVTDPEKVAHCLPELVQAKVLDATHFEADVRVGLGPVRGKLALKFELQPDATAHRINMKVSGGGLGSAIDLTAGAQIVDAGDGTALLDWTGSAEMRGPVASVGGRVLDAQANKLITQTFAAVREKLSA